MLKESPGKREKRTSAAKEAAEKVCIAMKDRTSGASPIANEAFTGTGEPVPLSKTDFLRSL